MLPNTNLSEAGTVAERIRASIAAARLPLSGGLSLQRTVSLGIAGSPATMHIPLDILLQQADKALYQAKAAGRNRACSAPDTDALITPAARPTD
ncbi:MAG: diguanylate cyclase [Blastochloris sp.]|nr:diguanylate cyclase [Blastochloris sp.]